MKKYLVDQLNVYVKNKTGQYRDICAVLAGNGIDIRADMIAGGVLRAICTDAKVAVKCLQKMGYKAEVVKVVAVSVGDNMGDLLKALAPLERGKINIRAKYGYSHISKIFSVHIIELDQDKLNQGIALLYDARGVELLTREFMLLQIGDNVSGII